MKEILETRNYSKFELLPFNRKVEKIKDLTASMTKYGWLNPHPLHVVKNGNGKLRIKAGHHRFTVARTLGLPIKYVVSNDDITIYELEKATNPWKQPDYLHANIREGKHSYVVVQRYHERTGIPLGQCISMLAGDSAGSANKTELFKTGYFELGDPTYAEMVAKVVAALRLEGITWAANAMLVKAISKILWVTEIDLRILKNKIKTFSYLIKKQPSVQHYIEMIESIYNRQNQNKVPIAFLADQKAKERSAIKR